MNKREVVRSWLKQERIHGKNSSGSLFYDGTTIYSYGFHFPIARLFDDVILFTTYDSSMTTNCHKGLVHRMCDRPVFEVPHVNPVKHEENLKDYECRARDVLEYANRKRVRKTTKVANAEIALNYAREANRYAKRFDQPHRYEVDTIKLKLHRTDWLPEPEYYTTTVLSLLNGEPFNSPILADALQDAGYENPVVLSALQSAGVEAAQCFESLKFASTQCERENLALAS